MDNPYETERYLHEYLLFHYGTVEQLTGGRTVPVEGLHFAQRCVTECLDVRKSYRRGLDLGCAVGGAAFELTRCCEQVLGLDFSQQFISAAQHLQRQGCHAVQIVDEGELSRMEEVRLGEKVQPQRAFFQTADAQLPLDVFGTFEVVLLANLIDRLPAPRRCLEQLAALVQAGGQLIITSPYTWLETFTPRNEWLGGFISYGNPLRTLDGLKNILSADFNFVGTRELPFLIREHARKFQWSVAEASLWERR
jgi:putative 4-mercaptohistidine N1-methyltranferase